jgi:hypothetical protein
MAGNLHALLYHPLEIRMNRVAGIDYTADPCRAASRVEHLRTVALLM